MVGLVGRIKAPGREKVNDSGTRERGPSTLINRNVFVGVRRTSLRLEPAMWDAMAEICRREEITVHDLCELIDERRRASSLTAAIRAFIVTYFRAAATEEGHASTGHGTLDWIAAGPRGARGAQGAAKQDMEPNRSRQ